VTHLGAAIVVWSGGATDGPVHFQRFDAAGVAVGPETEVSDIRIGQVP